MARPLIVRRRPGFTLLEVLLVLCVLVAMAVLAWPALERPLANQRLTKAGERVRAQWARCRVEAMEAGQIRLFRFALDGNRFRLEWLSLDGSGDPAAQDDPDAAADILATGASRAPLERSLPEGVNFLAQPAVSAPSDSASPDAAPPAAAQTGDAGWSDPILFYPDGTTSTAQVTLRSRYNRTVSLQLRGLTGVVTMGPVGEGQSQP